MQYIIYAKKLFFALLGRLRKNSNGHPKGIVPKQYIKKFLPKKPVIVEAGAHIGSDTIEMSKLWPKGSIYAFEPIPHLFGQLIRNTEHLRNIRCYPFALSEKRGISKMFVSSGESDASSSLLPPKEHLVEHPKTFFLSTIEVQTTTLDLWAMENRVNKVDLLWLDMQGCELPALKASPCILRKVLVIYIEVFLKELYEGVSLYQEVRQWLKDNGFRLEREELPWRDAGNALFVRARKVL